MGSQQLQLWIRTPIGIPAKAGLRLNVLSKYRPVSTNEAYQLKQD